MSPEESRLIWEEITARSTEPRRALRWYRRLGRAIRRRLGV